MSIKALQQINAKQKALEKGLKQMAAGVKQAQTEKMRGIEAKANEFLSSSDPIGFLGKLSSESSDEFGAVINAARRIKQQADRAQIPQQETVTTAGLRELLTPQLQPQQQRNPRQTAIAGLPINPNMFRGAGGGIVAFQNKGFVDTLREREEGRTGFERYILDPISGVVTDTLKSGILKPFFPITRALDTGEEGIEGPARKFFTEKRDKEGKPITNPITNLRKTDQTEEITKEELDRRIAEQDSRDPFRDQRVFEPEVKKEVEEKRPIVPETATDAAIEEAGVDTKPISVEDAFAQAEKILKPVNISQNGAIGSGVEAPVDFSQKAESILKKAGVDLSDSAATAAIQAEKAALAGDKKEAVYMSLLELGFAIMGGKDPNAIVNIGKAGMQVAPALAKRIQATKDARRKVLDSELKLEELKNRRAEGIANISAKMQMNAENNAAAAQRTYQQVKGNLVVSILNNDRAMDVAKVRAGATVKAQQIAASVKSLSRSDLAMKYANADESERKILAEAIRLAYPQTGSQILKELVSTMANTKGSTIPKEQIKKQIESYGVTLDDT